MSRPRVAHVLNSMGLGGVPTIVYQLLRTLAPDGYDLSLYVLRRYADHADVREEQAERFRNLGVSVSFPDRDEKKFFVVGELCRWIIRDRIDILHTHSYKPNIYGRLAGLLCQGSHLKVISHYHNDYDNKWQEDNSLIFDQCLARSTARTIACSESVRDHVSERVGIPREGIEVILNGVELDRFAARHDPEEVKAEFGIPRDRQVVGVIGRISAQKAQDDFIQAARLIHERAPETVFLVVGSADDAALMAHLQDLTVQLGIEKHVRFLGYVPDIPRIYQALDVLVVPSRWEGFGLILVEAMAAGKPIVATKVGPIPEVVGSDGAALLVPPSSPPSIARAVLSLLADPGRAQEMGRRGMERARQFSWERAGRQLDELYTRLTREPQG